MRRSYKLIWIYISKEFIFSFIISFLFFFIVFFINQILFMAEELLAQNALFIDVVLLIFYATPSIIAMSFPFGSLVGALMAVGRLSSDNELLVMMASGLARRTIITPFVLLGAIFFITSFTVNDYFLPLGIINYAKVYRKMLTSTPSMELKPYSVKRYNDATISMGSLKDNVINDVIIFDTTKEGKARVISAKTAYLLDKGDSSGLISLGLHNVFIHETDPSKPNRSEYSSADKMEYNILLINFSDFTMLTDARAMSSVDVAKMISKKETELDGFILQYEKNLLVKRMEILDYYLASTSYDLDNSMEQFMIKKNDYDNSAKNFPTDFMLNIYKLEYHKKFSIPSGALFFVFLAFPLGARTKKNGRAVGFGIGLLVAVLYWAMLLGGQELAVSMEFNAFFAMWLPNIFIVVAALPFFIWRKY